jgi:hypothetical protein
VPHIRTTRVLALSAMAIAALILLCNDAKGQPVIFGVETDRGNDTLYVGEPSRLSFTVDGQGAQIQGLVFKPLNSGTIVLDTTLLPPANRLAALDPSGASLPLEWNSGPITVLPCPTVLGDVNEDGAVTSADVIVLVQCVFKCGPGPFDVLDLGNVDCGLSTTAADVIRIVNFVFKGVELPFCCIVLDP